MRHTARRKLRRSHLQRPTRRPREVRGGGDRSPRSSGENRAAALPQRPAGVRGRGGASHGGHACPRPRGRPRGRGVTNSPSYRYVWVPTQPHFLCGSQAVPRVRCPQPWPRPTTTRSRRRSSGDGMRSAPLLHRTRLQRPPAPDSFHKLHAAACAVLCGGHQERDCPQPLCGRGGERIRQHGSTARQHGALLRDGCVLPPSAPAGCPPSFTAHPAPHTSSRDTSPAGVVAGLPLCTHAPPPHPTPCLSRLCDLLKMGGARVFAWDARRGPLLLFNRCFSIAPTTMLR
jgi:hypothetical protein